MRFETTHWLFQDVFIGPRPIKDSKVNYPPGTEFITLEHGEVAARFPHVSAQNDSSELVIGRADEVESYLKGPDPVRRLRECHGASDAELEHIIAENAFGHLAWSINRSAALIRDFPSLCRGRE